ncbi:hypothetical protein ACR3K2_14120 [Cryptosporidium serpentis]
MDEDDLYTNDIELYSRAISFFATTTVSKIIREWYILILKKKTKFAIEEYIKDQRKNTILLNILKLWLCATIQERLNRNKEEYIVQKLGKNKLQQYFSYWYYDHYLVKRNIYRLEREYKKRNTIKIKKKILVEWRQETYIHNIVVIFEKDRITRRYFNIWKLYTENIIEKLINADKYYCGRLFINLLSSCLKCKKKKEKLSLILKSYELHKINNIFQFWWSIVQYSMNKRYKIIEWQVQHTNKILADLLNFWRSWSRKKKYLKNSVNLVQRICEINLKNEIFNIWVALTHESCRERTLIIAAGLSARRLLLVKGFDSLKLYTAKRISKKELKEKILIYKLFYLLSNFKKKCDSYGKYNETLIKYKNKYMQLTMRRCLYSWKLLIARKKELVNFYSLIKIKHEKALICLVYKIWNFVWFKNLTNCMIIECLQTKKSITLKKVFFQAWIWITKLRKSHFWEIFDHLYRTRITYAFKKLFKYSIILRRSEILEDKWSTNIWIHTLFYNWRSIAERNLKIKQMQNFVAIYRTLEMFIDSSIKLSKELFLKRKYDKISCKIILISWNSLSKRRGNIHKISNPKYLNQFAIFSYIRCYFRVWYKLFYIRQKVKIVSNMKIYNIKKYSFYIWNTLYHARNSLNSKYLIIKNNHIKLNLKKYYFIWSKSYKKKFIDKEKMNQIYRKRNMNFLSIIFKIMKSRAIWRLTQKQQIDTFLNIMKIYLLRLFWNELRYQVLIQQSLDLVSKEYSILLQKRKLMQIYKLWNKLFNYLKTLKKKIEISDQYYNQKLYKRYFYYWIYLYIARSSHLYNSIVNIQKKESKRMILFMKKIIQVWYGKLRKSIQDKDNAKEILRIQMRRYLYYIIDVYETQNYYKSRLLQNIAFDYLNSFIFELQYIRIMKMEAQNTLTLDIVIIAYQQYNLKRRHMTFWLKALYRRLRSKTSVTIGTKRLQYIIDFINKRSALNKLENWSIMLDSKEEQLKRKNIKFILYTCFKQLYNNAEDIKFTMEVAVLLNNNFIKARVHQSIKIWHEISQIKIKRHYKEERILMRMQIKWIKKTFLSWYNFSKPFIKIYLLIKSIEMPFKQQALNNLKCYSYEIFKNKRNLSYYLMSWFKITKKKQNLSVLYTEFNVYYRKIIYNLFFSSWRSVYRQKIDIIEFHNKVAKIKPMSNYFKDWRLITMKNMLKLQPLIEKVKKRQMHSIFNVCIILYRLTCHLKRTKITAKRQVWVIWKEAYYYSNSLNKATLINITNLLKKSLFSWVLYHYAIRREDLVISRIKGENRKTTITRYFLKWIYMYKHLIKLRNIEISIVKNNNTFKLRHSLILWKNATLRMHELYNSKLIIKSKNNHLILNKYFTLWISLFKKLQKLNEIYNNYYKNRTKATLYRYLIFWKSIWLPHRYINSSTILIQLLNKIKLHEYFHKLLIVTFYGYTFSREKRGTLEYGAEIKQINKQTGISLEELNINEFEENEQIQLESGFNFAVPEYTVNCNYSLQTPIDRKLQTNIFSEFVLDRLNMNSEDETKFLSKNSIPLSYGKVISCSYRVECRCSVKQLEIIRQPRYNWIILLLDKIARQSQIFIIETLEYMLKYSKKRKLLFESMNSMKIKITRSILCATWNHFKINIERVYMQRKGEFTFKNKRRLKVLHRYFEMWILCYNNKVKHKLLIKNFHQKHNNLVKTKCYLLWSIKFHIEYKKKILLERAMNFQIIYAVQYSIKLMKTYSLYQAWSEWCGKVSSTIKWIRNFRCISSVFLQWRDYSHREQIIKKKVLLFYNKNKIRLLSEWFIIWLRRLQKIMKLKRISINFYQNHVLIINLYNHFISWKILAMRSSATRKKIKDFLNLKSIQLKHTSFKLWRFFVHYYRSRNERFGRIYNVIVVNHNSAILNKLFYSWKLKTIELLSLRNSIYITWGYRNSTKSKNNLNESTRSVLSNSKKDHLKRTNLMEKSSRDSHYSFNSSSEDKSSDEYEIRDDTRHNYLNNKGYSRDKSDSFSELEYSSNSNNRIDYENRKFLFSSTSDDEDYDYNFGYEEISNNSLNGQYIESEGDLNLDELHPHPLEIKGNTTNQNKNYNRNLNFSSLKSAITVKDPYIPSSPYQLVNYSSMDSKVSNLYDISSTSDDN